MQGTIINVFAILAGSLAGILIKKGIPPRIADSLLKAEGLAILTIGISSTLAEMFRADMGTGVIRSSGGLVLLVSLVAGCLIGEAAGIDERLERLGRWAEGAFRVEGFAKGFVNASLVFCVGTMTFVGPITERLAGDGSILHIKAVLDGITSLVLASTMGVGVLFAAVPVLVIQGGTGLLAGWVSGYITPELLSAFCMVGYVLVSAIGLNFLYQPRIKVPNLLPALPIAVLYHCIW